MIVGLAELFPLILTGSISALLASPLLIRVANRVGLVDVPGSAPHKRHLVAMPLAGGPVLALSVAVTYVLLGPQIDRLTQGILAGSSLMFIWGMLDDRLGMSPMLKLIGQALACAVLIYFGVQVRIAKQPLIDLPLTFFWVVGLANAFNFVDSMDGLALGLASIATAFFMLVTLDAGQPNLAGLSAASLGASLGLFFFNASPAKLFLGDSGAQLLGFMLSAIGIAYVPARAGLPQGVSWFTPILVLAVPIFDAALVSISRIRRRRPAYRAQRDHTYHRLVAMGMHPSRSVLAMQLAAILLSLVAFMALGLSVIVANMLFGSIVIGGLVFLVLLERVEFES